MHALALSNVQSITRRRIGPRLLYILLVDLCVLLALIVGAPLIAIIAAAAAAAAVAVDSLSRRVCSLTRQLESRFQTCRAGHSRRKTQYSK